MDEEEMMDEARKITLDTLCWKLKTNEFSNPQNLSQLLVIRTVGYLNHLPIRLMERPSADYSIDNLEESLPDSFSTTPEEVIIRKENLTSLLADIDLLPNSIRGLLYKILSGESLAPKEKKVAAQALDQLDSVTHTLQNRKQVPDKSFKSREMFGIVDNNGIPLFADLAPGQAFWLISNLTQKQKYATFVKTGYLPQPPPDIGNKLADLLKDAKDTLNTFRNWAGRNTIPRFNGEITEMLKGAESVLQRYSDTDEDAVGKNFFRIRTTFSSTPELAQKYSGIRKDIIILILGGKTVPEISDLLNTQSSKIYSQMWEISRQL
jgi:hypothetical protein